MICQLIDEIRRYSNRITPGDRKFRILYQRFRKTHSLKSEIDLSSIPEQDVKFLQTHDFDEKSLNSFWDYHPLSQEFRLIVDDIRDRQIDLEILQSSPFVAPSIKKIIYEFYIYRYQLLIRLENGFLVNLMLTNRTKFNQDQLIEMLDKICLTIQIFVESYQIRPISSNILNFQYYHLDLPKQFPNQNTMIIRYLIDRCAEVTSSKCLPPKTISNNIQPTVVNINSGFCTFGDNNRIICIYRNEEFVKVLLHEMCHYYRVEKYQQLPNLVKLTNLNFVSNIVPHPKELITEAQTIFLYWIYLDVMSRPTIENWHRMIHAEINYQRELISNWLKYSGVDNIFLGSKYLYTNTNAVYYYFLKLVLFSDINNFLIKLIVPNSHKLTLNELIFDLQNKILRLDKLDVSLHQITSNSLRMCRFDTKLL